MNAVSLVAVARVALRLALTLHRSRFTSIRSAARLIAPAHFQKLAHTYSIVACDSATGDLGVAVQSKFPNVGGIVPWAQAGRGRGRDPEPEQHRLRRARVSSSSPRGATAEEALRIMMRTDTMLQDRQVGMVDARGNAASFTGRTTFDWAGGRVGAPGGRATSPAARAR